MRGRDAACLWPKGAGFRRGLRNPGSPIHPAIVKRKAGFVGRAGTYLYKPTSEANPPNGRVTLALRAIRRWMSLWCWGVL